MPNPLKFLLFSFDSVFWKKKQTFILFFLSLVGKLKVKYGFDISYRTQNRDGVLYRFGNVVEVAHENLPKTPTTFFNNFI
jgi:serine O-acetyltransferase